jgi:hypothetical protein
MYYYYEIISVIISLSLSLSSFYRMSSIKYFIFMHEHVID